MSGEPLHHSDGKPVPDLASALATGARQIHIRVSPDRAEVLGRIEGKLCPIGELPPEQALALIESLERGEEETAARYEIASTVTDGGRVAVITPLPHPASEAHGELPEEIAASLRKIVLTARGLVLFSGPAGSGREAVIDRHSEDLAGSRRNVLRLEHGRESLSRLAALDPDCLVLPEVSSPDEMRSALSLARAGHLVFASVEETDGLGAVRLAASTAESRGQLSRDLAGVLSMRRIAAICPHCGFRRRLSDSVPDWLDAAFLQGDPSAVTLRSRGSGCKECSGTGYAGWTSLFEFVPVRGTDLAAALAAGLDPLQARIDRIPGSGLAGDAWRKISRGEVDIEELRHLPPIEGEIEAAVEESRREEPEDRTATRREQPPEEREDPFILGRNVLAECYGAFAHGRAPGYESIQALAEAIVADTGKHPGRGVHCALDGGDRDFLRHHFNTALLSVEIGHALDWAHDRLLRVAVAALLHGVGTVAAGAGDREEGSAADMAAERLRSSFPDQDWLAATVSQVDERMDGSGSPEGRTGDRIDPLSRVIGLADYLETLTHPDGSQAARTPFDAIQFLMKEQAARFDRDIFRAMVRRISLFPVGSRVQLNNGSVARVVSVNSENFYRPRVEIERDSAGRTVSHGETLDLADSPFIYITGPLGG